MILVARPSLLHLPFALGLPFTGAKARPRATDVMHRFRIHLTAGRTELMAPTQRGITVCCHAGTLWITQDGELDDVILNAGESFTAQRRRDLLLYAMRDTDLEMQIRR